ncbi:MAG: hypothetical protein K0B15_08640 [Lentimicrobium sp.]|nr:hypothetical protein [Lentimicrobium sp.]
MEEKLAKIISYIFHPLLMPTYAFLILFNQSAYFVMILPEKLRWAILAMIIGNTFILPVIIIWFMLKRGLISSLQIPERSERTFPFIIAAISYFATYFMISNLGIPAIYQIFVLGGAILIAAASLINLFWKISAHMLGIGGILGGFLGLMLMRTIYSPMLIVALVIIASLIAFARLKLNTHNEAQVYTGFIAGVFIMLGIIFLL